MGSLPGFVTQHLVHGPLCIAWLRLKDGVILELGGALAAQGLQRIGVGDALVDQVPWAVAVQGELPLELKAIERVAGGDARSDLSAWEVDGETHVVLVEATAGAGALAVSLQRGNEDEFLRERLAGAERRRKGERRERSESLSALGYEILEQGPDGVFRPMGTPAPWFDQLCGWGNDEPRGIHPGDPIDFLSGFLGEALDYFAGRTRGLETEPGVLSSGVWTEIVSDEAGGAHDTSFEAFAIVLSTGRTLVAVERLGVTLSDKQQAMQRARDAELSYEGLAREMQVKEVLLHCIVHDLRGPLSTLVGSLSLLDDGQLTEQERAEVIEIGRRQAQRQDGMIRNVLEVFSAEVDAVTAFETHADTAPDLAVVAREAVERQGPAFRAGGVDLELELPGGSRPVVGRTDRLERVVANLIGNALRHAPAGSVVTLRVEDLPDGGVQMRVLDRGPGVPPSIIAKLFQRFVQGGSGGAAGLGLYYVRMTVERWGGSVAYAPREGGGADFQVRLVTAPPAPAAPPVENGVSETPDVRGGPEDLA